MPARSGASMDTPERKLLRARVMVPILGLDEKKGEGILYFTKKKTFSKIK